MRNHPRNRRDKHENRTKRRPLKLVPCMVIEHNDGADKKRSEIKQKLNAYSVCLCYWLSTRLSRRVIRIIQRQFSLKCFKTRSLFSPSGMLYS